MYPIKEPQWEKSNGTPKERCGCTKIPSIHEGAKKLVATKDPIVLVHTNCQNCLDLVNNHVESTQLVTSRISGVKVSKLVLAAISDLRILKLPYRAHLFRQFVAMNLKMHNGAAEQTEA